MHISVTSLDSQNSTQQFTEKFEELSPENQQTLFIFLQGMLFAQQKEGEKSDRKTI